MSKLGKCLLGGPFNAIARLPVFGMAVRDGDNEIRVYTTRELTPRERMLAPKKCDDTPVVYDSNIPDMFKKAYG